MSETTYTIAFSDPTKATFTIQQGVIDGPGQVQQTTDLSLPGFAALGYGQSVDDNFIHLLENFAHAGATANTPNPGVITHPTQGQLWFNSANSTLFVYNGTQWNLLNSAYAAPTTPLAPHNPGDLWYNTATLALMIWNGTSYDNVTPPSGGFGVRQVGGSPSISSVTELEFAAGLTVTNQGSGVARVTGPAPLTVESSDLSTVVANTNTIQIEGATVSSPSTGVVLINIPSAGGSNFTVQGLLGTPNVNNVITLQFGNSLITQTATGVAAVVTGMQTINTTPSGLVSQTTTLTTYDVPFINNTSTPNALKISLSEATTSSFTLGPGLTGSTSNPTGLIRRVIGSTIFCRIDITCVSQLTSGQLLGTLGAATGALIPCVPNSSYFRSTGIITVTIGNDQTTSGTYPQSQGITVLTVNALTGEIRFMCHIGSSTTYGPQNNACYACRGEFILPGITSS